MAVRNFWIEADIDGRATKLSGGPRAKDGGFYLTVFQRNNGHTVHALHVAGYVGEGGELVLDAWNDNNRNIRVTTKQ